MERRNDAPAMATDQVGCFSFLIMHLVHDKGLDLAAVVAPNGGIVGEVGHRLSFARSVRQERRCASDRVAAETSSQTRP